MPASWIFYGLLLLAGVTVAANLQSIGGLLVSILSIVPAASACQLTYNPKAPVPVGGGIRGEFMLGGNDSFLLIDLPSRATIVPVSSLIFLVINAFSPRRRVKNPL